MNHERSLPAMPIHGRALTVRQSRMVFGLCPTGESDASPHARPGVRRELRLEAATSSLASVLSTASSAWTGTLPARSLPPPERLGTRLHAWYTLSKHLLT